MNIKSSYSVNFSSGIVMNKAAACQLKKSPFSEQESVINLLKSADDSKYYDLCYAAPDKFFIIDKESKWKYLVPPCFTFDKNSSLVICPYESAQNVHFPLIAEDAKKLQNIGSVNNARAIDRARVLFNALEASKKYGEKFSEEIDKRTVAK